MKAAVCSLCNTGYGPAGMTRDSWLESDLVRRLAAARPDQVRPQGVCPACLQEALLHVLLDQGDAALHDGIQSVWPLDAEAAFGALPTPLRMHAHPHYTGRGITLAMVDAGFYPHPDLTRPRNRIRAWADASAPRVVSRRFRPDRQPRWPGWDEAAPWQWHGMMTSASAAGNGRLSHGLYRGVAPDVELVLVQVRARSGGISEESIARALSWLADNAASLGVRIVSISVGGSTRDPDADNEVHQEVRRLVDQGITVVAAAGNDGQRRLVPPATAPEAITIGGLDDKNAFDHEDMAIWHSNFGVDSNGASKPELVAPSIWVVAPMLPGTPISKEAAELFKRRAALGPGKREAEIEEQIARHKLVTPHYQHVEGTSFAAPLTASVIACMLQANPELTPALVRHVLLSASRPVAGAEVERQGAGALDAGRAVKLALRETHAPWVAGSLEPRRGSDAPLILTLHDRNARRAQVVGSWDDWGAPGIPMQLAGPGLWKAAVPELPPGRHQYKFLVDGTRWQDDPDNPRKTPDGVGGLNSILIV